jgi:hypothetical protein
MGRAAQGSFRLRMVGRRRLWFVHVWIREHAPLGVAKHSPTRR